MLIARSFVRRSTPDSRRRLITSPSEPLWLSLDDVIAIHREQIKIRGGPEGVREHGLVASAVHRPYQLYTYDGERDLLTLAVRLAVGIAQNHGLVDGNKRTAVFAMIEFLAINGAWLAMPNDTRLARLFRLTIGKRMSEEEFAAELYPYIALY
jgi:death-on-curing protein